jgi:hypothetical protein
MEVEMATSGKKPAVTKPAVKQAASKSVAADGEKKAASKASSKADAAPAVTSTSAKKVALNPARAWPFPTGARPK